MEEVEQAEHRDAFYGARLILACLEGGESHPVWDMSDAWLLMSSE